MAPPTPLVQASEPQELTELRRAMAMAVTAARTTTRDPSPPGFRDQVLDATRHHLEVPPWGYRDDCSGFVSAIFTRAGAPMDGVVASVWDLAVQYDLLHWRPTPTPGDLVFFDDTWDRNKNGRVDDELSHIAIVLEVHDDGTIVFADNGTSRGRSTGRMNLLRPDERKAPDGKVLNQVLRRSNSWDPSGTPTLTSQLWVGFAAVDPALDWETWVPWVELD